MKVKDRTQAVVIAIKKKVGLKFYKLREIPGDVRGFYYLVGGKTGIIAKYIDF